MSNTVSIPKTAKQCILGWDIEFGTYANATFGKTTKPGLIHADWGTQKEKDRHSGGLATLNGAYLVAVRPVYGKDGDLLEFIMDNGKSFKAIKTDEKGTDIPASKWGHLYTGKYGGNKGGSYSSIVEFNSWNGVQNAVKTLKEKGIYGRTVKQVINYGQYNSKGAKSQLKPFKARYYKDGQPKPEGWYKPNSSKNPFAINPATNGNCTWYAYGRFCEIAGKTIKRGKSGNAVDFYDASYFPSCKRGKTPKLGAIICWGYGSAKGNPGHVAVVEEIKGSGNDLKIRVTHSGYSGGWNCSIKHDTWLSKKHKFEDTGLYDKCVFRGFIYNPVSFNDDGSPTGGGSVGSDNTATGNFDMQKRASQLYSSDNYQYVSSLKKTTDEVVSPLKQLIESVKKDTIEKVYDILDTNKPANDNLPVADTIVKLFVDLIKNTMKKMGDILRQQVIRGQRQPNTIFDISRYLVEAPFVEIKIGNNIIGSYDGTFDKYPNYVTGLEVTKTNGSINQYSFQLVHQIRVGEDPNLLDKMFAQNQFNKITISYGDTTTGQMFKDIHAIITNINMNRDYASARITYSVQATSACTAITSHIMNFPAVVDKPSNVIRKMLFSSALSQEFKEAFPGMASQTVVDSKGLIPTNDKVLQIEAKTNIDPITYLNYLVSCMSNEANKVGEVLHKSSYYIFYKDDQNDGASFQIQEIQKTNAVTSYATYETTIGYPDRNNTFSFNVTNDKAWAIMYDKNISSTASQEYVYTIENNGDIQRYYSPSLNSASQQLGERDRNWWSFMVGFPVSATLTMRGLLRPAFLTNYIKINVVFYGQKHIASGLYAITEQKDTLNGSGFRTTFSLVRIGED